MISSTDKREPIKEASDRGIEVKRNNKSATINIICDHQKRVEYSRRFQLQKPVLHLSSDPRYGNVYLHPLNIAQALGRPLDSISLDLCEIAAYVYLADKAFPRGHYGKWTRNFSFLVPVRNPQRWKSVAALLAGTVSTLSGDNVQFHFVQKVAEADAQPSLSELKPVSVFDSDCVCLFSGGLDSLAGAVHLIKKGRRPLFAGHYISGLKSIQGELMATVRREFDQEFEHFQYRVTSRKSRHTKFPFRAREGSHRARSFMFLSFATVAAATRNLSEIYICENGVMSLNVPISDARKGSRSTRHAHPVFLQKFNLLINSLYGRTFSVQNPFRFWTKGEEVGLLAETNLYPMIKKTVTCWGYPNQTIQHKNSNHCGYCVPCLVRRISLEAAGLAAFDDHYIVDVFKRNKNSKEKYTRNFEDLVYFCRSFMTLSKTELLYRYPELVMVELGAVNSREDRIGTTISMYRKFAGEVLRTVKEHSADAAGTDVQKAPGAHLKQLNASAYL
jgi:7-cyano-7-deazaguanine synthase in queuosine biosynthesis